MSGHFDVPPSDTTMEADSLSQALNRGYVCPENAGPDWRAAFENGVDMALLEDSLAMTPVERLAAHQQALSQALMIKASVIQNEP